MCVRVLIACACAHMMADLKLKTRTERNENNKAFNASSLLLY
jgi:hypothetical protein